MSRCTALIAALLCGCVVLPILLGATCGPPRTPYSLAFTSTDINPTQGNVLASCNDPGSVCISFNNQTNIPVEIALYYHDGFDRFNEFVRGISVECCTIFFPSVPCNCPCEGYEIGECELLRPEIFDPSQRFLQTINGLETVVLNPGISTVERVQCGDVKTIGVSTAKEGAGVLFNPEYQEGPRYRAKADETAPEGEVPCGETIEFKVIDLNESTTGGSGSTALVSLIILVNISEQQ